MQSNSQKTVRGWLFDIYPTVFGEMTVWIISENGERVRLTDRFQPKVYVTGNKEDLERLIGKLYSNRDIAHWDFIFKFANPTDSEKSKVLEVTLKDCRRINAFTNEVLKLGDYLRYEVHNCDLHGDRAYLFEKGLFPLAFLEVESDKQCLKYKLLDKVESIDYVIPSFRVMRLSLEVAKEGKLSNLEDPIGSFQVEQGNQTITIDKGTEEDKLLELVKVVKELDPDIVITNGGDSYLFSYLIQRANFNKVLDRFLLSRDNTPFVPKPTTGKSFFSYGRVFYKAPTMRLSSSKKVAFKECLKSQEHAEYPCTQLLAHQSVQACPHSNSIKHSKTTFCYPETRASQKTSKQLMNYWLLIEVDSSMNPELASMMT